MERIDKVLSNLGLLSRSECKKYIQKGRVLINGEICKSSDIKVDPESDVITLDGAIVDTESMVYYVMYKPAGVITANEDKSQACVFDLIEDKRRGLSAVGRLDKDTTGILIITNDGECNHRLVSPKHHVPKRYEVVIDGKLSKQDIEMLEGGIDIGDDKPTLPATLELLDDDNPQKIAITITEGRYHQVKRMFAAVGCPVIKLHRSDFGPLHLPEDLNPGEYRKLTPEEKELLIGTAKN